MRTQTPPPSPADTLDVARTVRTEQLIEGRVLSGRYQVVRLLGAGGMGEVWLAEDRELDDMPVAVKVLPPLLARNPRSVAALKREAALSLKLTHPNICRLHGFQSEGELKFLVMEYIDGQTLEELLDQQDGRTLSLEQLRPIAEQIATALDYAHSLTPPVLHRDIKPGNIMVTADGTAKLLDFGIARELKDSMTRVTGQQTTGTLLYMAPEQFAGKDPTPASDVYAFAATLYECLKGRPPFHQGAIGHQLLHMEPGPIAAQPDHVNAVLLAGLAKVPTDRPASARGLVDQTTRTPAPPVRSEPTPPKPRPRASAPAERSRKAPSPSPPAGSREKTTPKTPSSSGLGKWIAIGAVVALLVGLYGILGESDSTSPSGSTGEAISSSVESDRSEGDAWTGGNASGDVAGTTPSDSGRKQDATSSRVSGSGKTSAGDSSPRQVRPAVFTDWPFDSTEAKRRQERTARALGLSGTTKTLKLPGGETLELVLIPAGTFKMGSPDGEGFSDERPQRMVTLSKPFWLGKTEVTIGQVLAWLNDGGDASGVDLSDEDCPIEKTGGGYRMKRTSGDYWGDEDQPMVEISWTGAKSFCDWLSRKTNQSVRLPTEAEWEYACRAGSEDAYCYGDDASKLGDYAWYTSNSSDETHPVGKKKPNAFGLHDMHGNVWEWCHDGYQDSYKGLATKDPKGPNNTKVRVLRGGGWSRNARYCRSADRSGNGPAGTGNHYGVRVVVDFK